MREKTRARPRKSGSPNLSLIWAPLALLLCCAPRQGDAPREGLLGRPQAILWLDERRLLVTDSGYTPSEWAPGRLLMIDWQSGQIKAQETGALNPQALALDERWVYLLNSGPLDLSQDPPTSGIASLQRAPIDDPLALSTLFELPPAAAESIDFPTSLLLETEALYLGSGLHPALLRFELNAGDVLSTNPIVISLPSSDDPEALGLVSGVRWKRRSLWVDFNSDRLGIVEADGRAWSCSLPLGRFPDALEGAQSPLVVGKHLYYLLALSGELRRLDLQTLSEQATGDCDAAPSEALGPPLGQVPQALIFDGEALLILDSLDHWIERRNTESGELLSRWPLPAGSNPWSISLSPTGAHLAVSAWASGALLILDAKSGALLKEIGQPAEG
ncbi:MAG: hypothetical protein VYD19_07640 [Myxococcota bacterium]|nr:hypothetical protein [Myxococcota bacterium]